jgi:hypothetical protein
MNQTPKVETMDVTDDQLVEMCCNSRGQIIRFERKAAGYRVEAVEPNER